VGRLSKRLLSAACIRLVAGECETGRWVRGSREKGVWCFRVTHPSAQLHAEDADLADPVRHDVESTGRRVWVRAFRWFLVSEGRGARTRGIRSWLPCSALTVQH
jgi:hypothetical protein